MTTFIDELSALVGPKAPTIPIAERRQQVVAAVKKALPSKNEATVRAAFDLYPNVKLTLNEEKALAIEFLRHFDPTTIVVAREKEYSFDEFWSHHGEHVTPASAKFFLQMPLSLNEDQEEDGEEFDKYNQIHARLQQAPYAEEVFWFARRLLTQLDGDIQDFNLRNEILAEIDTRFPTLISDLLEDESSAIDVVKVATIQSPLYDRWISKLSADTLAKAMVNEAPLFVRDLGVEDFVRLMRYLDKKGFGSAWEKSLEITDARRQKFEQVKKEWFDAPSLEETKFYQSVKDYKFEETYGGQKVLTVGKIIKEMRQHYFYRDESFEELGRQVLQQVLSPDHYTPIPNNGPSLQDVLGFRDVDLVSHQYSAISYILYSGGPLFRALVQTEYGKKQIIKEFLCDQVRDNIVQSISGEDFVILLKRLPQVKDFKDSKGNTLFHLVASHNLRSRTAAESLLRLDRDYFLLTNNKGQTALDIMAEKGLKKEYVAILQRMTIKKFVQDDPSSAKKLRSRTPASQKRKM